MKAQVVVRPFLQADLDEADRIFRMAFGTFLGAPEPERFFGDADAIRTRWRADPSAALAAELGGRLVGSNFAANWGSVGFLGPTTVAPGYWDRAVGQRIEWTESEIYRFDRGLIVESWGEGSLDEALTSVGLGSQAAAGA